MTKNGLAKCEEILGWRERSAAFFRFDTRRKVLAYGIVMKKTCDTYGCCRFFLNTPCCLNKGLLSNKMDGFHTQKLADSSFAEENRLNYSATVPKWLRMFG